MKTPSTKIAKMDDCNDSSSHGDSLLSSDSDGEYQVARGKTRQPQTASSKQLKYYHAMKECQSATVSAEHDLALESV